MRVLGGVDAAFLHLETRDTPMHVASLHLFDLPPGYRGDFHARVKRQMARRVHLAPIFERRLAPMPLRLANPAWVRAATIDLDYHVQRVTLPPPGTLAQLEDCAARLHGELLDRSRPLWRLFVIDGLQTGQVGYYIKAHHAVLDGNAAVLVARALFDPGPRSRIPRSAPGAQPDEHPGAHAGAQPDEHPAARALLAAALRHDAGQYLKFLRRLPDVVRTLAGMLGPSGDAGDGRRPGRNFMFGPRTPLNVPITAERGFAGLSLPLDALTRLAAENQVKLNDIVLALCSGALRRYLARCGGVPRRPLTAAMPISLREAGDTEYTTRATMPLVNLHTDVADPLRRLRAISDSADAVKSLVRRASGVVPMDFPSIGLPWLLHGLAWVYGSSGIAGAMPALANVVISNIPGPKSPLYLAGARMSAYWPLSIVQHGVGLNITVMSYAGVMGFGFTTARAAVPDPRRLTSALAEAFDELVAATAAAGAPSKAAKAAKAADAPPRRKAAAHPGPGRAPKGRSS